MICAYISLRLQQREWIEMLRLAPQSQKQSVNQQLMLRLATTVRSRAGIL